MSISASFLVRSSFGICISLAWIPAACMSRNQGPGDGALAKAAEQTDTRASASNDGPNGVMFQYFHWYLPADGQHWKRVGQEAKALADAGISALWLPPAYKGAGGGQDVGYGVYDLFDLGEFDQKGSVRTKYGNKAEYLQAIDQLHKNGVEVYADLVLNHMMGADGIESVVADRVDWNDRQKVLEAGRTIDAYVKFDFPGRVDHSSGQKKYSDFSWKPYHFDGVDYDARRKEVAIFRFQGQSWDPNVSSENANYDYLMGADLNFQHPEVRQHIKDWAVWYAENAKLDGFRLDAIKHIDREFFNELLYHVRSKTGKDLFAVGENWTYELATLDDYANHVNGGDNRMSLFDAPLHRNFHEASKAGGHFDMGSIFNHTLVKMQPTRAVTLVENHDTQPLQALESPVEDWFKPLAYALILLRQDGYPCVFYPDYYGASYRDKGRDGNFYDIVIKSQKNMIDILLKARRKFAYGLQRDYLDHQDLIGWTRSGTAQHPGGLAVLMSDGPGGSKWMEVGKEHAGQCFVDLSGAFPGECATVNQDGWAEFKSQGGNVSVWADKSRL